MLADALRPLVYAAAPDHHALRAGLIASQLLGLVLARYILGVGELPAAAPATVIACVAPTVQRYLTHPVPEGLHPTLAPSCRCPRPQVRRRICLPFPNQRAHGLRWGEVLNRPLRCRMQRWATTTSR